MKRTNAWLAYDEAARGEAFDFAERYRMFISETLTDGPDALFTHSSAWTFNRTADAPTMIDEYIVDYEQYPAIGRLTRRCRLSGSAS